MVITKRLGGKRDVLVKGYRNSDLRINLGNFQEDGKLVNSNKLDSLIFGIQMLGRQQLREERMVGGKSPRPRNDQKIGVCRERRNRL